MTKRLTVIYEVPDDYNVTRITGTGELEVVRCESMDVMQELGKVTARLAEAEKDQRIDRINLIAWVLRNMDQFGCFSGDCPHDLNSECIESIIQQYEEDEAAKGGGDE